MNIKVVEIFKSIEAEGRLLGIDMVFIRLEGCNLRCSWCDTKYSYDGNNYKNMSIEDIKQEISKFDTKNLTITGGEPVYNDGFDDIVKAFKKEYFIKIETNGTIFKDSLKNSNLYICCSPKEPYFIDENLAPFIDEIKFVIDDKITLKEIKGIYNKIIIDNITLQPQSYDLQNSFKKAINFQEQLKKSGIQTRVIPQIHKFLDID